MLLRCYYSLRYLDVVTVFLMKENPVACFAHHCKPLCDFFYFGFSECMDPVICGLFSQLRLNIMSKCTYFVFSIREAGYLCVGLFTSNLSTIFSYSGREKKNSFGLMECNEKMESRPGRGATQEE